MSYSLVNTESPQNSALNSTDMKNSVYERVLGDIESVKAMFEDKQDAGKRNTAYYAGRQWAQAEIDAHHTQRREPYVFNEIQHKVDHLVGTQTQTRLDAVAVPREQGDTGAAELLTFILKWNEQINTLETVETTVFQDAVIKGYGAAVVRWETEDIQNGYPKIEKIPTNELYWDSSSIESDLSDARWMARVVYMSQLDAIERYPQHKELIERQANTSNASGLYNVPTYKQDQSSVYGNNWYNEQGRSQLRVIEHYERAKVYRFIVANELDDTVTEFDKRKEAEDYFQGLIEGYSEAGIPLGNPDGSSKVILRTDSKDQIYQSVAIGDKVAEYNALAIPDFPYVVCFAYFADGDFWGFVDSLIDPQKLVNRMFSQWDYAVGTSSKGAITVMESLLRRGFNMEDFRREISKTSPVIPVLNHNAVNNLPNNPIRPEMFQAIQFGIGRMADYAGGKNALGIQETAGESGRAVLARAEQGGLSRLPLFDKLKHWRRQIAIRQVWWIKNYMSPGQVMRVIGNDKDVQYMNLDDGLLDTIKEIQVDITIDEVGKSETIRERSFQQISEILARIPNMPPEISLPMLVPYTGIQESQKQKLLSYFELYQQYEQQKQKADHEQKLIKQVQDNLMKKQIKEEMTRADDLQEAQKEAQKKEQELQKTLQEQAEMQQQAANMYGGGQNP